MNKHEDLVKVIKTQKNEKIRKAASDALVRLGKKDGRYPIQTLCRAMQDLDTEVQSYAVNALIEIGTPGIIWVSHTLGYCINDYPDDPGSTVGRQNALKVLMRLGPSAISFFNSELTESDDGKKDKDVLVGAICALSTMQGARAIQPLIIALGIKDSRVQRASTIALVKIGAPAVEPLCSALKTTNPTLRIHAAETLKELCYAHAIPQTGAAGFSEEQIRSLAGDAINKSMEEFDMRRAEERQKAEEARRAAPQRKISDDEEVVMHLISFCTSIEANPDRDSIPSDLRAKIREIGVMLNDEGGKPRMKDIIYKVERYSGKTLYLQWIEMIWDGIGDWVW